MQGEFHFLLRLRQQLTSQHLVFLQVLIPFSFVEQLVVTEKGEVVLFPILLQNLESLHRMLVDFQGHEVVLYPILLRQYRVDIFRFVP